jgi:hypothetical protein
MPEVNQYLFKHSELLELLIKKADLHQGKWMLTANLGFGPGNFGPSPDQMSPGAVVAVLQMGIQKAPAETPEPMTMDAAVVNPILKASAPKPKRGKA